VKYTGTLIKDLESMVAVCLRWNARVCAICAQCYGVHSEYGAYCPSSASAGPVYLKSTFVELHREGDVRPSVAAPAEYAVTAAGK
jgi:hypothetical protein